MMAQTVRILICTFLALHSHGFSAKPQEGRGSISGTVVMAGSPIPGITVLARAVNSTDSSGTVRETTDSNGLFHLTGLPAGRYRLTVLSSLYVTTPGSDGSETTVTLGENDHLEKIELRIARGAVISGRVIDRDGHPLIGEHVSLMAIDEQRRTRTFTLPDPTISEIDDRGIYRIYGLPAGRYIVSAGQAMDGTGLRVGARGPVYSRTFHPSATEETEAAIIELGEGSEADGIDIEMDRPVRTHHAAGRVVSAETGQPIPLALLSYGSLRRGTSTIASAGSSGMPANANGEFLIEGLTNGRYAVWLDNRAGMSRDTNPGGEFFSDPVEFEIDGGDAEGIEIRVRRACSINGIVISEDGNIFAPSNGPVQLIAVAAGGGTSQTETMRPATASQVRIQPNGSFRLSGLTPGRVTLSLNGLPGAEITRIDRGGVSLDGNSLQLVSGEQLTGVRIVVAGGSSSIHGRVAVSGGTLPPGTRLLVSYRPMQGSRKSGPAVRVDPGGAFIFDRLAPGSYLLTLVAFLPVPDANPLTASQTISISNGSVGQTVITLDLSAQ